MSEQWYAIVDQDNNLYSTGTVIADDATLEANGFRAIKLDGDPSAQVWDKDTLTFTEAPASTVMPVLQFVRRFQPEEYVSLLHAGDPATAHLLMELNHAPGGAIDVAAPSIQHGLNALVEAGLLTQDRAAIIGTP